MRYKNFIYPIVIIFYSLAGISHTSDVKNPIKIGMSAAFSGSSKDIGTNLYTGAMSYLNYINNNGGIDGRIIKLIKYDDGYNPIPALQNTLRLIKEDDVLLLFSYVGTPTVTRVLPLLKINSSENFYLFFPLTGAQPHREPPYSEFVFNLRASYREETAGIVNNLVNIGRNRIAVFYQADAYGRSGWDGINRALDMHDLKIVGEATYKRGADYNESFREQIDIMKGLSPDAIISIGSYEACAGLIRDIRNDDWDIPIANLSFVGSESLLNLLLNESKVNNKDYTHSLINSEVVPNYDDISIQVVKDYRMISRDYNFIGLEGFINAKLIVEIIKRMGDNPRRDMIKKIVENISDYDIGLDQKVSFSPDKHQAFDSVYFNTVRDGKWVTIKSWDIWKK